MTATTGADWQLRAACRDASDPDQFITTTCIKAAQRVATTYCRRCPVQAECGEARQGGSGIWAGQWFRFRSDGAARRPVDLLDGAL